MFLQRIASSGRMEDTSHILSLSFLSISLALSLFTLSVKLSPTSDAQACLFRWNPHPPSFQNEGRVKERTRKGGQKTDLRTEVIQMHFFFFTPSLANLGL